MTAVSPKGWEQSLSGLNIHRINNNKQCFRTCDSPLAVVQMILSFHKNPAEGSEPEPDPYSEHVPSAWDLSANHNFALRVVVFQKTRLSATGAFLKSIGISTELIETTHYYIFFMYRAIEDVRQVKVEQKVKKIWDVYAITIGDGWRVVKPYAHFGFPIRIATRLMNPKLSVVASKPLAGNEEASVRTYRVVYLLADHELDTIWKIFKVFTTSFAEDASIMNLSGFENRRECQVEVGYGKVRILRKLPIGSYPAILNLFSQVHRREPTYKIGGEDEIDNPSFEYLNNIQPVDAGTADQLTFKLVTMLYDHLKKGIELPTLHFCHRYHRDYYRSHQFEFIYDEFKVEWDSPPSAGEVIEVLAEALQIDALESPKDLHELLKSQVKFRYSGQLQKFPLLSFFGCEMTTDEGKDAYFFNDGVWLKVSASHLEVVQRAFYSLISPSSGRLIARPKEETSTAPSGWLSIPWAAREEWVALTYDEAEKKGIKRKNLDAAFAALKERRFCFINPNGTVMVDHVAPCILKDVTNKKSLDKKWSDLNCFLKENKGKKVKLQDLKNLLEVKDKAVKGFADEVWASLQKSRPLCTEVSIGRSSGSKKRSVLRNDGEVLVESLDSLSFEAPALNHFRSTINDLISQKKKKQEKLTRKYFESRLSGRKYSKNSSQRTVTKAMLDRAYKELVEGVKIECTFKGGILVQGPVEQDILTINDSGKTLALLRAKHEEYSQVCKEEAYNRLYLGKKNCLVCDQVYADDREKVELFDLLQLDPGNENVYLYHVKSGFGQPTREACAQIRIAAQNLRADMEKSCEMLGRLYDNCMRDSSSQFRQKVKEEIQSFSEQRGKKGKKGWIDFFQSYLTRRSSIVFVYAFVDKGSPERRLEEEMSPSHSFEKELTGQVRSFLYKGGYLDKKHRLTEKFLTTKKTKLIEELSKGPASVDEAKLVYQQLDKYASVFRSMGAKVELLHAKRYVEEECGFGFKVLQLNRSGRGLLSESSDVCTIDLKDVVEHAASIRFSIDHNHWKTRPRAVSKTTVLAQILGCEERANECLVLARYAQKLIEADQEVLDCIGLGDKVTLDTFIQELKTRVISEEDWEKAAISCGLNFRSYQHRKDDELGDIVEVAGPMLNYNPKAKPQVITVELENGEINLCDREDVPLIKLKDFTATVHKVIQYVRPRPLGTKNSGTDCFINSLVQCFVHTSLSELLSSKEQLKIGTGELDLDPSKKLAIETLKCKRRAFFKALSNTFAEYYFAAGFCRSPTNSGLRECLSELSLDYPDALKEGQQDVGEVLTTISRCFKLDEYLTKFRISNEPVADSQKPTKLKGPKEDYSQINDGRVEARLDDNFCTTLPVPKDKKELSFQDCLEAFLSNKEKVEKFKYLDGDKAYESDVIAHREVISWGKKGIFFSYNRFEPTQLKSGDFSTKKREDLISLESLTLQFSDGGDFYSLKAFICHKGTSAQQGHYVTYCLCSDEKWYLFDNDDPPKETNESGILEAVKSAYVIYFEQAADEEG